ncbi:MAG: tRNA (adenosine(37)-N6)-dimethylallyltransferase MiaA [Betaproteobacteria bacterium]
MNHAVQSKPPLILCITGPTATGKTELCVRLSKNFPLEVISMDSALVYRHMNIGTAKPTTDELASCQHHLIDIIDPVDHYSAARFKTDAERLVFEIVDRGNMPVILGGTMMYYNALVNGLDQLPSRDDKIREQLDSEASLSGWPTLHEKLSRIDPDTASRLNPNDAQRIQRALEVFYITGETMSSLLEKNKQKAKTLQTLDIALIPDDRTLLHKRIEERFAKMLAAGLVDEVDRLRRTWELNENMPSMRCVGYRQAWSYLEGRIDKRMLHEQGVAATRQLAKRQLTWLRSLQIKHQFDPFDEKMELIVSSLISKHLT